MMIFIQRLNEYTNEKALITGITGQDGSYLAEFLLEKGVKFTELSAAHLCSIQRVDHIYQDPHVENHRFASLWRLIRYIEPVNWGH